MNNQPKINTVILKSIPLDKNLKRYYISKYKWLCTHNGVEYASNVFKQAKETMLAYRADRRSPKVKLDSYLRKMPFRKNGWLRMLFGYMDSHPYYVLNFLKLYVGPNEPITTVEQSANVEHSYLLDRSEVVNDDVPWFLKAWMEFIKLPYLSRKSFVTLQRRLKGVNWNSNVNGIKLFARKTYWPTTRCFPVWVSPRVQKLVARFFVFHDYQEYLDYHRGWKARFQKVWNRQYEDALERTSEYEPLPEMYKDFSIDGTSENLELDLLNLYYMGYWHEGFGAGINAEPTLSAKSLDYVFDTLNPDVEAALFDSENEPEQSIFRGVPRSILDGAFVGHIHHIPKKGTVTRRPIAVPNRFLQRALVPCYLVLSDFVAELPKDCTYNQSRFDTKIENRVTNSDRLYVGSVDLSHATDNLPFSWGRAIWNGLFRSHVPDLVQNSWNLFVEMTQGRWENDGQLSRWTVGQPLGCLPSFMVLSITHNIFLESLSLALGMGHSPYCVLGDDVLIFNKKVRKHYISQMTDRGIPLSLHKSYEGNLVEFAGKIFIKNQVPHYVSDQAPIYWSNLFDYQRSTGVLIPYNHLPSRVRRKFSAVVRKSGLADKTAVQRVYRLCQLANVVYTDSPILPKQDEVELLSIYAGYVELYTGGDGNTAFQRYIDMQQAASGIVNFHGHPVTYLDYGYAEKHGYKMRFQEVRIADWFKKKFRPVSTDIVTLCASMAVKDLSESLSAIGGS